MENHMGLPVTQEETSDSFEKEVILHLGNAIGFGPNWLSRLDKDFSDSIHAVKNCIQNSQYDIEDNVPVGAIEVTMADGSNEVIILHWRIENLNSKQASVLFQTQNAEQNHSSKSVLRAMLMSKTRHRSIWS